MQRPFNVLFFAPAIRPATSWRRRYSNWLGQGNFKAFSAGVSPKGRYNHWTLELLAQHNLDTSTLRSKGWENLPPRCPQMDFILTVCDQAAGEQCPAWRAAHHRPLGL